MRPLFCGNGRNEKGNEQCKMVLVCNWISDGAGVCGFPLRVSDQRVGQCGNFWYWDGSGNYAGDQFSFFACAPS